MGNDPVIKMGKNWVEEDAMEIFTKESCEKIKVEQTRSIYHNVRNW
jgi:hypothetical protein